MYLIVQNVIKMTTQSSGIYNISLHPLLQIDAQEVLQRKSHLVNKTALHIRQNQQETAQDPPQMSTSLVVLENVQESMEQCMLVFLVENVSFLSEEDNDFIVEMIPERNAAVITLFKPTGKRELALRNKYYIFQFFKEASQLENERK